MARIYLSKTILTCLKVNSFKVNIFYVVFCFFFCTINLGKHILCVLLFALTCQIYTGFDVLIIMKMSYISLSYKCSQIPFFSWINLELIHHFCILTLHYLGLHASEPKTNLVLVYDILPRSRNGICFWGSCILLFLQFRRKVCVEVKEQEVDVAWEKIVLICFTWSLCVTMLKIR